MFNSKPTFGSSSTPTFGSTGSSLFGQQSKPAGSSLFGQSTANTSGSSLFGQKPTTNLFGSSQPTQQTSSVFGATNNANTSGSSLFGQSKPMFGGSQQSTGFGTTSTGGGLFGSSTTGTSTVFGSTSTQNGTALKFVPVETTEQVNKNGTTQNIKTKNMCISAMKEYEGKSFEELRVEDYVANRKAPTAGSTSMFGGGSSTTTSGGLFGGNSSTPQKSLFGASASSTTFGSSTAAQGSSLFGQTSSQPAGSSLFGSKPAGGGSLFGSTTNQSSSPFGGAAATSTNTFGTSTNSLFGQTTTQPTTSLFGSPAQQQNSGSSLFGNTSTTTNLFGQQQAAQPAAGGLFGNTNTSNSMFGKPATTQNSGFSFSTPATTTNAFGQAAAPAGGGLFGSNTAAKPGGLFGNTAPAAGGLFGSTATQPAQGGLFGGTQQAQPQQGGLFGTNTAQTTLTANPSTVSVPTPVLVLGSDVNETRLKMAMIEANLASNPYGGELLKMLDTEVGEKPNPNSYQRQMKFLAAKTKNSPMLNSSSLNNSTLHTSLNTSANNSLSKTSFLSSQLPVAGSALRRSNIPAGQDLNYKSARKPPTIGNGMGNKGGLLNSTLDDSLNISRNKTSELDMAVERALSGNDNALTGSRKKVNIKYLDIRALREKSSNTSINQATDPDELPREEAPVVSDTILENPREAVYIRQQNLKDKVPILTFDSTLADSPAISTPGAGRRPSLENVASQNRNSEISNSDNIPALIAAAGVTLASMDYFCEPTILQMQELVVDGKVVIPNGLTIGRATYGSVYWPGKLELSDVALDEIVIFRHKEVTVYPDDTKKPPLGEGLNKPAEVTLERVWHVDRSTKEEIKDPLVLADIGWRERLEKVTAKMGAFFKDYRPSTGSWVFRVEHFSKYGLPDEDDEDLVVPPGRTSTQPPISKEQTLHSKVQRVPLQIQPADLDDMDITDVPAYNVSGADVSLMPPINRSIGLGGVLSPLMEAVQADYDSMHEISDEDFTDGQFPPEKKMKVEDMDIDYLYEESKALMEKLNSTVMRPFFAPIPKCKPPTRSFTGGVRAKQSSRVQNSLIDEESSHGGSSRVGWSAGGKYSVSLQPYSNQIYVKSLDWATDVPQELICDMLEHNIRLSQTIKRNHSTSAKLRHCEIEGQQVSPRIKPTSDHAQLIDSFLATARQSQYQMDERVWKLCKALFPQNREGGWKGERLSAVSEWFVDEIALRHSDLPQGGRGSKVWRALCRGSLSKAIDAAIEEDLHFVAAYLAVFMVNPRSTATSFKEQISFWETSGTLSDVDTDVLKVYLIMAGMTSVRRKYNGKMETLNCLEGLSWKESVAIHAWWLCAKRPFEVVMEEAFALIPPAKVADDVLFFNLIKLSYDTTYRVESALDAASLVSESPLDSHLCWHLWSVMRSVGYNTMTAEAEQRLHVTYSEQLISAGVPNLALFVLSHISNDQCRSMLMRECLNRIAPHASSVDYDTMSAEFDVPKQWVADAKFIPAINNKNYESACELAIQGGDLLTAHRLFVEEVAPQAVVCDDLDRLAVFVKLFTPVADKIPNWGQNGQLYADYVDFKQSADDDDDDKTMALIASIEGRLQAPVFNNPIQRLCAENIALEIFAAQKMVGNLSFELPLTPSLVQQESLNLISIS